MTWKCQGPRGADINVCASLNPNLTAYRQLSPFIMAKITPEMVNAHTRFCKAHFSCFQHLFEYLQLANKDLDLGLHTLSVEQQWKQRWAAARQDALRRTMNSPPNTVQGLSSLPRQFRWWRIRGKNKLQPQILESFLSPATCLAFLRWYR